MATIHEASIKMPWTRIKGNRSYQHMSYQYGTVAGSNIQIKASNAYRHKYIYHKTEPIVSDVS